MAIELLQHQNLALDWFQSRFFGLLAFDTGTGKTLPALSACLKATKHYQKPSLYITFASLRLQVFSELNMLFTHARACAPEAVLIVGNKSQRAALYEQIKNNSVIIASYETILQDIDILSRIDFACIIADECTRLSNPRNKQFKAMKRLRSTHRYALTGTPVQNSPVDVYGIFEWLSPSLLGSWYNFMQTYTVRHPTMNFVITTKNLSILHNKIAPYMLQCKREDVLKDLPTLSRQDIPIEFTSSERNLYNSLKDGFIREIAPLLTKVNKHFTLQQLLPRLGKLLELCDSTELITDSTTSSKLDALEELITSKLQNSKIVIITRYSRMATLIHARLHTPKRGCVLITGDTPMKERAATIARINDDPATRILIGTRSVEYGLNLQKSVSTMIHYDAPFSYASLIQREARIHRHGQSMPVTVYNLYIKGSVEEKILKNLDKKKQLSEELLNLESL